MTNAEWASIARVIRQARWITDALKEISVADLKSAIEQRERYQNSERFAAIPEAQSRAGVDLTNVLKIVLRFRAEIIAAEPTAEDQDRAVEHAQKYFLNHPDRLPPGAVIPISESQVRDFLEGKR